MLARSNKLVLAFLATVVLIPCCLNISPRTSRAQEITSSPLPRGPLGVGDRLKVAFFETIDVTDVSRNGKGGIEPQGALRTFYQRMDLGGEYAVEQDGTISIPLLGRFQVDGRAVDDVR